MVVLGIFFQRYWWRRCKIVWNSKNCNGKSTIVLLDDIKYCKSRSCIVLVKFVASDNSELYAFCCCALQMIGSLILLSSRRVIDNDVLVCCPFVSLCYMNYCLMYCWFERACRYCCYEWHSPFLYQHLHQRLYQWCVVHSVVYYYYLLTVALFWMYKYSG